MKQQHSSKKLKNIFLGALFILLLLGSGVALWLSQKNQDTRQDASVDDGLVLLTSSTPLLTEDVVATTTFSINTQNIQVSGLQLSFVLHGDFASEPTLEMVPFAQSGLNKVADDIKAVSGGYEIKIIALPTPATPFMTSVATEFLKVSFTPSSTTPVSYTFDPAFSKSLVFDSDPLEDELNTLGTISVPFALEATATPIAGATNTPTPLAQATNTPTPSARATSSPTPTATARATSTPTPIPGVGGSTGRSCNTACESHSQCAVNLMCSNGHCRLATNPSSTSCVNPPDTGIHRTCGQYCSDTNECQSGLTCWYNSCRNPQNVQSNTCAAPATSSTGTGGTKKVATNTSTPKPTSTPAIMVQNQATPAPTSTDEGLSDEFDLDHVEPDDSQLLENEPVDVVTPVVEDDTDTAGGLFGGNSLIMVIAGLSLLGVLVVLFLLMASKRQQPARKINTNSLEHPVNIPLKDQTNTESNKGGMSTFAGPTSVKQPDGTRDDFKNGLK